MFELTPANNTIPPMTEHQIDKVNQLENVALKGPRVDIQTTHNLHGGIYTRTVLMPAGTFMTGALIKIPTTVILSGDATVILGAVSKRLVGYNVIAASAHRKQAFASHSDTYISMFFPTDAKTIKEAEEQFTDDHELLISRRAGVPNKTLLKGE